MSTRRAAVEEPYGFNRRGLAIRCRVPHTWRPG